MNQHHFHDYFDDLRDIISSLNEKSQDLVSISDLMVTSILRGNSIYWMGNGGSASDAQHLAAELVGRFERNRRPLSSFALNTDTSVLTSIANDFGFSFIFSRQIEAHATAGDVCVGITTSGKSQNIIEGLKSARNLGLHTITLAGSYCDLVQPFSDYVVSVSSEKTSHIQESHIAIGQAICGYIENRIVELNDTF